MYSVVTFSHIAPLQMGTPSLLQALESYSISSLANLSKVNVWSSIRLIKACGGEKLNGRCQERSIQTRQARRFDREIPWMKFPQLYKISLPSQRSDCTLLKGRSHSTKFGLVYENFLRSLAGVNPLLLLLHRSEMTSIAPSKE